MSENEQPTTNNQQSSTTRCGTIALIGAPNAGKSTLSNRLVGAKVSIVTPKAQTTRSRVTAVCMEAGAQMVFLDVPGVFDAKQDFERAMVNAAWNGARGADVIMFMQDARKKPDEETEAALARVLKLVGQGDEVGHGGEAGAPLPRERQRGLASVSELSRSGEGGDPLSSDPARPHPEFSSRENSDLSQGRGKQAVPIGQNKPQKNLIIVLNKIDAVEDKKTLLLRAKWFSERADNPALFMISARKGDGVEALKSLLATMMPEGPYLYDEDALTDMPMRLIASELTREQCFLKLQEEIPYTLTVETEKYETKADGSAVINQIIIVQNERQKTIVIGEGGQMLKAIGERARHEIGRMLGAKCHLYLFVKVRADWKEKPEAYRYLGLEMGQ
ncbi:MAG: GTPase Era [Rickettsiales bacterium]